MEIKADAGDYVSIKLAKREVKGTILESYDKDIILVKLESGYNIGIPKENVFDVKVIRKYKGEKVKYDIPSGKGKPKIGLIVTGGTIASKLDARTGGVRALTDVEEFAKFYPKLFEKYDIKINSPFMELSENMNSSHWKTISKEVKKMLDDKQVRGIIITHGSDTLHYTSSILSFFLRGLNKPVALTFSQRSIDRGSSDAELNLECAAQFVLSNCAEVVIVGHATENDNYCYALRGTKVRKMHTSRRDTFKAINCKPIAKIGEKVEFLEEYNARKEGNEKLELDDKFSNKVALVKFYPGMDSGILNYYKNEGYKGLVLEMTGLGHVSSDWIGKIKACIKSGMFICASAQTINGSLNPKVYSTGREIEKSGVIYLKDMLSETAFVKLGWVLGHRNWNGKEKEKMLENFAGEFSEFLSE
ncbi:glutamyl-tRNA(Gln) amidotransferase subunit D [Candidatus Pacearchaeota archaeon CG1_02_32_132]|nr:MAG: glutamyl-tRNA(Gln) amidotransferase subunit D [Candidatus Pacearchaeota archaeon CG1_02_32_132]